MQMRVLRGNVDSLLTVLNVFRHDPLYSWTVSPVKARALQQADDGEEEPSALGGVAGGAGGAVPRDSADGDNNAAALRAISRVKQKLHGREFSDGAPMSVSAQVRLLVDTAQDPDLLGVMYPGWAMWV